jgi:hypothetical protein
MPGAFPEGHILINDSAVLTDNQLSLSGSAKELCPVTIPPASEAGCRLEKRQGSDAVVLDLTGLNRQGGWSSTVNVSGGSASATLWYEPCDNIGCPPQKECQGVANAAIWLCESESGLEICTAYGEIEDGTSMSLVREGDIKSGIRAVYAGDMRHSAAVTFLCGDSWDLELPSTAVLDGRRLEFTITTYKACLQPKLSGGSVFLVIVLVVAISYVTFGVLWTFLASGTPDLPNKEFWAALADGVIAALTAIRTCNYGAAPAPVKTTPYEKI